jgi:thioredoxin-like negative regulator of GroEL
MPFTAEDCCDAGAKAASEEDWAGAAKWFGRARTLAPTSARICADLAFSLSQIGDVDEALRHYAEASRLCADGEADFNGALAALHGARPLGEIEEWLERALARSPGLVMPLEADDDFKVLHGRTRYERAVDHAWQCLARRGEGPGPA